MDSLWERLSKPIFSLAPMEDVTDTVFRQILCSTGKPDVFFTEFTNVDGIASQGHDIVARRLLFTQVEHPIIAQIWGMKPENYFKAAKELVKKGFDGIDINMGCPQHDVIKHGACSALIKNTSLAKEIIQATKEGVTQRALPGGRTSDFPISVKTRIGFKNIQTEEWIGFLLQQNLPLITVHGRTAAEMSKVPAYWDEIGKAVRLRDEYEKKNVISSEVDILSVNSAKQSHTNKKKDLTSPFSPKGKRDQEESVSMEIAESPVVPHNDRVHTLIFGNGDVVSLADAKEKVEKYHVDGVMIGRGIFHNPWLFAGVDTATKTVKERLTLLEQHVSLYEKTWGSAKSFQILKKYFKIYLSDFEGASDMRQHFMETNLYSEAKILVRKLILSS